MGGTRSGAASLPAPASGVLPGHRWDARVWQASRAQPVGSLCPGDGQGADTQGRSSKIGREVAHAVRVTHPYQTEEGVWLGSAGGGMGRSTVLQGLGRGG